MFKKVVAALVFALAVVSPALPAPVAHGAHLGGGPAPSIPCTVPPLCE